MSELQIGGTVFGFNGAVTGHIDMELVSERLLANADRFKHFEELYDTEYIEFCAKVAHNVGRGISDSFNLPNLPDWDQCHPWYRMRFVKHIESYLYYGYSCRKVHNNWVRRMTARGWTLGEKDKEKKQHPNLMDFMHLPVEVRLKEKQIRAAVMMFRKHDTNTSK